MEQICSDWSEGHVGVCHALGRQDTSGGHPASLPVAAARDGALEEALSDFSV